MKESIRIPGPASGAVPAAGVLLAAVLAFNAAPLPAQIVDGVRTPGQLSGDLERSTGRVVLLHFWASWCIPCRAEMNELAKFRRNGYPELAEDGLRVVTISNDVRDGDLERFAEQVDLAFPVYYDPYSKLTGRYGVRGLPSTVVLDADGRVVDQMLGAQSWSSPAFHDRLRQWLDRRAGDTKTTSIAETGASTDD
ncbi:MAG: TlpA disulfide reductase family protein [Wenzhouxiangellaceae bacterium]|nr:TlpA disulfide reductase family protein [Wenzhouxiangellaceae bacterium]